MTYSLVARDPQTGELGAAVQSHWFSVGALCIWARPGVGAVATQSVVEPAYGPRTLDRLAAGEDAAGALQAQLALDAAANVRQVAVIAPAGAPAVHTGEDCIAAAGQATGPDHSCQANMMAATTVPDAMSAAFEHAEGPLADRLLAALHAAEAEGGDVRGRQSAALLVVPPAGEAWETTFDLRVEDHADPVAELSRLAGLRRAYDLAGQGDDLLAAGKAVAAGAKFKAAGALEPDNLELRFWAALGEAHTGDLDAAARELRDIAAAHPGWLVLLDRLTPEFAPAGDALRQALRRVSR